jgi:tetratricopeptide (TPR) repeat protein
VDQISKAIVFDNKAVRFANRGYSYLALGNFRAALADADAGISREPAYPATYAVRAIALHGLGRDTEAVTAIDHALALEPGSAHYWHVKGRIFATPGTCMGAREALETSLALDPQYEQPWPGFASARTDLAILESTCPSSGSTGVS